MKSQKFENCTLKFPLTVDFFDLGTVEQVVEEVFIKEPRKRRRKA
jgi:hypothetical protein